MGSSARQKPSSWFPLEAKMNGVASKDGAVELAEVIDDNGGETVLMMTWEGEMVTVIMLGDSQISQQCRMS